MDCCQDNTYKDVCMEDREKAVISVSVAVRDFNGATH